MERSLNSSYLHKREMISSTEELTQFLFQRAQLTGLSAPFLLPQVLKLKISKHLEILKTHWVAIKRWVLASANTAADTSILLYLERMFTKLSPHPLPHNTSTSLFYVKILFSTSVFQEWLFSGLAISCAFTWMWATSAAEARGNIIHLFSQKMWELSTGVGKRKRLAQAAAKGAAEPSLLI